MKLTLFKIASVAAILSATSAIAAPAKDSCNGLLPTVTASPGPVSPTVTEAPGPTETVAEPEYRCWNDAGDRRPEGLGYFCCGSILPVIGGLCVKLGPGQACAA